MDNLFSSSHHELQLPPAQTLPLPPPILESTPDEENDDIYRGLVGLPPIEPTTPRVEDYFSHPHFAVPSESSSSSSSSSSSTSSSSSSSTSSSSTGHGRRLGALAALVERAISRWARGRSDSGSSSSSSSASTSSSSSSGSSRARSRSRSFSRRRRRRRRGASTTSINSIQREYAPSRIAQARQLFEYSRRLPKEFTLLLPPHSIFSAPTPATTQLEPSNSRVIKTTSSKVILAHLETLLRRPPRGRGPRRLRADKDRGPRSSRIADLAATCPSDTSTPSLGPEKGKGKMRLGALQTPSDTPTPSTSSQRPKPHRNNSGDTSNRTWWLDVASPSWEDMRALGKLLHLHPLTLEDILQREQREKLEVFPGLGYYFVVFRAVEPYHHPSPGDDEAHHRSGGSDPVVAVTVYLVVFREGICSFHFEDISEHTDRVRHRILQLEKTIPWTPDWIAHGLLDSIVDGFFPIIQNIEKEVDELDGLVSGIENTNLSDLNLPATIQIQRLADMKPTLSPHSNSTVYATADEGEKDEKHGLRTHGSSGWDFASTIKSCIPGVRSARAQVAPEFEDEKAHFSGFSKSRPSTVSHPFLKRLGNVFLPNSLLAKAKASTRSSRSSRSSVTSASSIRPKPSARYNLLLRIAACRRLVTSLTRILTPKNEVVAQIRKRITSDGSLVGNGGGDRMLVRQGGSGLELDIYWGDVQDHIMTMHHSLVHYERILSHSHPAYLSHLRWSLSNGKGGTDLAILKLTSVTITCFAIQLCVGVMSMNVNIPRNRRPQDVPDDEDLPPGHFYTFGGVLAFVTLVVIGIVNLIRYWWRKAKRKYRRHADI